MVYDLVGEIQSVPVLHQCLGWSTAGCAPARGGVTFAVGNNARSWITGLNSGGFDSARGKGLTFNLSVDRPRQPSCQLASAGHSRNFWVMLSGIAPRQMHYVEVTNISPPVRLHSSCTRPGGIMSTQRI